MPNFTANVYAEMSSTTAVSFFPTAKELAKGMTWIKKHPFMATAVTAAATAVSVIAYLRHGEDEEDEDNQLKRVVSWSDDHGGSLTHTNIYLDDCSSTMNEDPNDDPADSETETENNTHAHPSATGNTSSIHLGGEINANRKGMAAKSVPSLRRSSHSLQEMDPRSLKTKKSDRVPQYRAHSSGEVRKTQEDGEIQKSPQWGWYVSITPPQEQQVYGYSASNSKTTPPLPPFIPKRRVKQNQ